MTTSRLARALNTLGYLLQMVAWVVMVAVYLPLIQQADVAKFLLPSASLRPAPTLVPHTPGSVEIIFMAVVVAAVLALTLYALITFPARVGASGDKVVKKAAAATLPVLTQHRQLSPKSRRRLTLRLMYYIRAGSCLVPVVLAAAAPSDTIPPVATMIIATTCGMLSLVLFSAAYLREAHLAKP